MKFQYQSFGRNPEYSFQTYGIQTLAKVSGSARSHRIIYRGYILPSREQARIAFKTRAIFSY